MLSFVFLAVTASHSHAASYHSASPPNFIVLSYPSGNLTANQTIAAGFGDAGQELMGDYYGFAWNTSLSLILPDGTPDPLLYASNAVEHFNCSGHGSMYEPGLDWKGPMEVLYNVSKSGVGRYVENGWIILTTILTPPIQLYTTMECDIWN